MTHSWRLYFVDERLQLTVLELKPGAAALCEPHDMGFGDDTRSVLVLPSAAALPFQIELPFPDPAKISRVLPQYVADLYVDVDESWVFSWHLLQIESTAGVWKIAGLAFPPEFAPRAIMPGVEFRLAVPDLLLPDLQPGHACCFKTPVSSVMAVISADGAIKRLLSNSSGVPVPMLLAAEGIDSLENNELTADLALLSARLESLCDSIRPGLDLSGYRQNRLLRTRQLLLATTGALFILWIFLWHFFVWVECRIAESAARRTRGYMQQAFSAAFPGIPVVEPLTQTSRSIAELEKRLQEASGVPKIPWQAFLAELGDMRAPEVSVVRLTARDNGFRLNGLARNYAALEAIRARLEKCRFLDKVAAAESKQGEDGINFSLEGIWKR